MSERKTKYNFEWEKEYTWLQKAQNDSFSAQCKWCKKTFSVGGGGICLIKQHEKTKLHVSRAEEQKNQLTFIKDRDNVVELSKKTIQFTDEEKVLRAEILHALKCVDANWSFQSSNAEGKRYCLMFPDSEIAKSFQLGETKIKYVIQFGIVPFFKEKLKDDLKNVPFTFKFDETTTQQVKKQYDGYTQYWSEEHQCIKIAYNGTLMVDHCPAEKLLEHFLNFIEKSNLDLRFLLHTGMDGPNVNLKFEELLKSSDIFKKLNKCILDIGTCPLHITHNGFRNGITKTSFNIDSFVIDINFFFKLSAARRADYLDIGSLTNVTSYFLQKHSSTRWVTLRKVCARLLDQFENLKRYFLEFIPTTTSFKQSVKKTDQYKRIKESLQDSFTVPYISFIAFIANDFEQFLTMFQSTRSMIHILHTEMTRLLRTLMSKFVKSKLLIGDNITKRFPSL